MKHFQLASAGVGAAVAAAGLVVVATPAVADHGPATPYVCNAAPGSNTSANFSRLDRAGYAGTVNAPNGGSSQGEGYHFGNACWTDDNHNHNNATNWEGPDCSGFVSKVWGLRSDFASNGGWHDWPTNNPTRPGGFYTLSAFGAYSIGGGNASFKRIQYAQRYWMDHVSNEPHDAIISQANSNNLDKTIEASCTADGFPGHVATCMEPGSGNRVRDYSSSMQAFGRSNWYS
jgi:hypothetical protein